MSIIKKIYREQRDLEREVFRLREENEELREECQRLGEFFRESTKPNPDFYRSIIELVGMIPENKLSKGCEEQKGKP